MTADEGSGGTPADEAHGPEQPSQVDEQQLGTEVITRLRGQLELMRGQLRRLHDALHQVESIRAAARERLQSLRGTAERIEQALRMEEAAQSQSGALPAPADEPSPAWTPMVKPGRHAVRHLLTVDVRDQHVHALLVSGLLSVKDIEDGSKTRQVVQALLDRWSAQYGQPAGEGEPAGDDEPTPVRSRRNGRERRHGAPRPNSLLSYVEGSALDRRRGGDRRRANARTVDGEVAEGGSAATKTPAAQVIRLDDHRAKRQRKARERTAGRGRPERADPRDSGRPLPADRVDGVEDQREPDEGEGHERGVAERLPVDEHREQELSGRRDVLEQAKGGERDQPGPGDEQDQR
jgi:hypothetical protein